MLLALFAVIFWTIMFFIACAVSPIVFFFMIIWAIYQYFKLLCVLLYPVMIIGYILLIGYCLTKRL